MWIKLRPKLQTAVGIFFLLAVFNFPLWMVIDRSQGGSALNGKVENGRYYLGDHGQYTEVSQSVYSINRTYETVSVIAFVATIVGNIAYSALHKNREIAEDETAINQSP